MTKYDFKVGDIVMYRGKNCPVNFIHTAGKYKGYLTIGVPKIIDPAMVTYLTVPERIRHAYPSLSVTDVEEIVRMVKESRDV